MTDPPGHTDEADDVIANTRLITLDSVPTTVPAPRPVTDAVPPFRVILTFVCGVEPVAITLRPVIVSISVLSDAPPPLLSIEKLTLTVEAEGYVKLNEDKSSPTGVDDKLPTPETNSKPVGA